MTTTQAQIDAAAKAMQTTDFDDGETRWHDWAKAALIAAAEVGEQQPDDTFAHGACVMKERCAQVAEWFSNVEKFTAEDVAAGIRALKE